jgi:hypothetical protein
MHRKMAMIIFLSIVTTIYFLVNLNIYRHTRIVFQPNDVLSLVLKIALILLIASYPLGRVLERLAPSIFSDIMVKLGSLWLGAMLYLTLLFFTQDIIRLIFWVSGNSSLFSPATKLIFFQRISIAIYVTTSILLIGGFINALYPVVNRVDIKISKTFDYASSLRVGAASDIHLGTVIANGRLERFVTMMNDQKPDIILLAGDIFDEDLEPVIKRDMGKLLSKLHAPLGVYAVTGNHEFIGGVVPAVEYLEKHGITVVRDRVVTPSGVLNIVGREDRQSKVMAGFSRKSLVEIMKNVDLTKLTILLDHQPYSLHEAEENGIDLQISGHTHHGQVWPFNFITKAIFEVSRGYKMKGNSHFYVSTGFGTWGPPIRIGNRPEIVVFDISFAN